MWPPEKQELLSVALNKKRISSLSKQFLITGLLHLIISYISYRFIPRVAEAVFSSVFGYPVPHAIFSTIGYILCCSFAVSGLLNFYKFLEPRLFPALYLGKKQLQLLAIKHSDPGFQEFPSPAKKDTGFKSKTLSLPARLEELPLVPVELSNVSWTSSPGSVSQLSSADSFTSTPMSFSPNLSNLTASSWSYRRGSEASMPATPIGVSTPTTEGVSRSASDLRRRKVFHSKSLLSVSQVDEGIDHDSLKKTNELMTDLERSLTVNDSLSAQSKSVYGTRSNFGDFSAVARGGYQLATSSPVSGQSGKTDEKSQAAASHREEQIWKTLGISNDTLLKWRENIRSWLCVSVLRRLASEIDQVNDILSTHGMIDSHIGHASLEKLRKTAQIPAIQHFIPSFDQLLPYLEVSTNQEYVVKRLHELSSGGCIGSYRWNSGGTYKGKPWDESLPTDSQLVMHILAVYLDFCLPIQGDRPDKKPFTGRHFFTVQEKPVKVEHVAIVEDKPAYKVVDKENTWEVTKGRNNLFDSVLLFFYLVKKNSDGIISRMVLDSAGLNIAWVFEAAMES